MINVGLVSHSGYLAGAERMLFNLAVMLKDTDEFNPILFLPAVTYATNEFETEAYKNNIKVVTISEYPWYLFVDENAKGSHAASVIRTIDTLKTQFCENNVDVVINNTATSICPAMAAVEMGLPVIAWIHGIGDTFLMDGNGDSERRLLMDRLLITLSNTTVCCSDWTRHFYERYKTSHIKTIHNWTVEPIAVKQIQESRLFICLNTFDQNKGIFILLEAAKLLKEKGCNFNLYFYGDGNQSIKNKMKNYIHENGLSQVVDIKGRSNNIDAIYQECLCLVQPSFIESFGMTVIEAMANMRPVIAAKAGGTQETIIDGVTGFIIEKNNSQVLAEKMEWVLDNFEQAKKMGENGRVRYENYFSTYCAKDKFGNLIHSTYNEGSSASMTKKLIYDVVIKLLYEECLDKLNPIAKREVAIPFMPLPSRKIDVPLCLSKLIKKEIAYNVMSNIDIVSEVGLIFSSHGVYAGSMKVSIIKDGRQLRNVEVNLSNIKKENWYYIAFGTIKGVKDKLLTIELLFDYAPDSAPIGVYENANNRDFVYKVCNKLGHHIKGMDALYTDFR